jgi:hypothetical protein
MTGLPTIEGSAYRYKNSTYKVTLDLPFVLNYPVMGLVEKFASSTNNEVHVKASLMARVILGLNADRDGTIPLKQALCKVEDFQIKFGRFYSIKGTNSTSKPLFTVFREARNLYDYINLSVKERSAAKEAEWPEPVGPIQLGSVQHEVALMITELITKLGISKDAQILDVGAYDNALVEWLFMNGFRNAEGIDVTPLIKISKLGRMMNFGDLSPKETFHVIGSFMTLDYYPGGMGNAKGPSLETLVGKYHQHLKPGGYLIIEDCAKNYPKFIKILESSGFKPVELPKMTLSYVNISQAERDNFIKNYLPKLYRVWRRE